MSVMEATAKVVGVNPWALGAIVHDANTQRKQEGELKDKNEALAMDRKFMALEWVAISFSNA